MLQQTRRQLQRLLTQVEREHQKDETIYQMSKALIEARLAQLLEHEAQRQAMRQALCEARQERARLRRSTKLR